MNTVNAKSMRSRLSRLIVLVAIPFLIAIIFSVTVGGVVLSRIQALNNSVDRLRAQGAVIESSDIKEWFEAETHKEGTESWGEIFELCTVELPLNQRRMIPYFLTEGIPYGDSPKLSPLAVEKGRELIREITPLLNRIHDAGEFPKPVWLPTIGVNDHRSDRDGALSFITRILSLEFDIAMLDGDKDRAIRVLSDLRNCAASFDWPISNPATIRYYRIRGEIHDLIAKSVSAGQWSPDELPALHTYVDEPINFEKRWQQLIAHELSRYLESEASVNYSEKRKLVDIYEKLYNAHPESLQSASSVFSPQPVSYAGIHDSGYLHFALSGSSLLDAVLAENKRKVARLAIGVRSYHQQFGHWPERLSELEPQGYTPGDLHLLAPMELKYDSEGSSAQITIKSTDIFSRSITSSTFTFK